jgi:hypothetical protein
MSDVTYCVNKNCPFTDCKRHGVNVPKFASRISVVNFDSVCRRYIGHLTHMENKSKRNAKKMDI